jgi:hypothetical protein
MQIAEIRTPDDFRDSAGTTSYRRHEIIPPGFEGMEPEIREAMDEIFADREYIADGESGLVSAFLDAIADPLARLHDHGFRLTAISSTETRELGDPPRAVPWSECLYVAAPAGAWFQKEGAEVVHLVDADCEDAGRELAAEDELPVRSWASREDLQQAFGGRVPTCPRCAPGA